MSEPLTIPVICATVTYTNTGEIAYSSILKRSMDVTEPSNGLPLVEIEVVTSAQNSPPFKAGHRYTLTIAPEDQIA